MRRAMRCTPIASVIVMSAGKPSGITDTAMPTTASDIPTKSMPLTHRPVSKDQYAHCRDNNGDGIAELLDLTQERRLQRAHAGEQLIDAAQLRFAPRRDDDPRRPARTRP